MQKCFIVCFHLFTYLVISFLSYGQTGIDLFRTNSIASPTVASLTKYADFPVNNHTGIPQIGIPIYTIKEGPLQLPIGLNYHAGGLKVAELASWVGAGWSLNAGGVITRSVQGLADERMTAPYTRNEKGHLSDGGYNHYVMQPDNPSSPLPNAEEAINAKIGNGFYDGEPDLFFFNFSGYSGKFYFHDDGRPVIVPQQDLKIAYDYTPGVGNSINSFIIITPDGTKYYFGKTSSTTDIDPIEKTHFYDEEGYVGTNNITSSWYLNKISSVDDYFSITLNYVAEEYKYYSISSYPLNSNSLATAYDYKLIVNWLQGVRLSSISFTAGTVYFDQGPVREDLMAHNAANNFSTDVVNTQARALGAIRITNGSSNCKKFGFTYNYFVDNNTAPPARYSGASFSTDKKRLRLDKIQEEDCISGTKIPPYEFEYFAEAVPRRLSLGIDHWGFNNGQISNTRLIPSYVEIASNDSYKQYTGADRDSYWPEMRAGSLKKIKYPTGGNTEFEFEANTTWVSYTKYVKTYKTSLSVGFSGGGSQSGTYNSITVQATGNPYTFRLNNSIGGSSCASTGSAYTNGNAEAQVGQIVESQTKPAPGNYVISISKPGAITGCGAEVTVYEWLPTFIQTNQIVGGLRIKSIKQYDNVTTSTITKNYDYNQANGQSSGHLYSRPNYAQIIRNDFYKEMGIQRECNSWNPTNADGCEVVGTPGNNFPYLKSPNSIRPMETTQGNHIGYNEVKVSQANNGYSIYRYYGSNVWDNVQTDVAVRTINIAGPICSQTIPNFPAAPEKHDFKRGELKYESHFKQDGVLLKEAWYYPVFVDNPVTTPALRMANGMNINGLATFYELNTAKKTELKVDENTFVPGMGYMETHTESYFESSFHNQITRNKTINSKGEAVEVKYKYSADFRSPNCDAITDPFQTYTSARATCYSNFNNLNQTYCNSCTGTYSSQYCRYWRNQELIRSLSLARQNYVISSKNYYNPSFSGGYAACMVNAKAAADVILKPIYELRDRNQVVPIEVSNWRNNQLISASFIQYGYVGTNVYPLISKVISLITPSTTFAISTVNANNTLSLDNRYKNEAQLAYNNGNPVEVNGKDGVPTSYIWGHNNTLPIVKASGVEYTTLINAYNSVGGNLSQLRTHASLTSALVTTYIYNPIVGITSETDPNGKSVTYEYDAMNRLKNVKDNSGNIVQNYCYNYAGEMGNCTTTPNWQLTGNTRCKPCPSNGQYSSNIFQQEQKDLNPNSPTYNQTQWIDNGTSVHCGIGVWQNEGSVYCEQSNGSNTGNQLQNQRDVNPCSPTYNQVQTVLVGYNPGACPLPPSCDYYNCYGEANRCVNGFCEQGYKIYTESYYDWYTGRYVCVYHYEWSDYVWSQDYYEYSYGGFCPIMAIN